MYVTDMVAEVRPVEPSATSGYSFDVCGSTTSGMTLFVDGSTVFLSPGTYESLAETAAILADNTTMKALRRGKQQAARGRVVSWEQVKRELGL